MINNVIVMINNLFMSHNDGPCHGFTWSRIEIAIASVTSLLAQAHGIGVGNVHQAVNVITVKEQS